MRFTAPQWRPSARKRLAPLRNVIDVSAFANVMFALLALLMGPSFQVVSSKYIPVDLARTDHSPSMPGALRDDAFIVTITAHFRTSSNFFPSSPCRDQRKIQGDADSCV